MSGRGLVYEVPAALYRDGMKIGITGSSGLIGTALHQHLDMAGHTVSPIVRRPPHAGSSEIAWDPAAGTIDTAALTSLDAVVHLAGAGIGDHRWNDDYKRVLLDSRVDGTTLLTEAIGRLGVDGPRTLISGSAIGIYGDRGDERVDEASESGAGFLSEICRAWEASTVAAQASGVRVAHLRTGIVLSHRDGALKKMLPLFKLGVGGRFGTGRQWMSWISIEDHVRAIEHLLTSPIEGAVNLTAPNPVRNADFAKTLGKVLHRPSFAPVPAFGPKLILGSELANALLFEGQHVASKVLQHDGFEFSHPELEPALEAVLDH